MTPSFQIYLRNSEEYWRQACEYLAMGKLGKASELAWGSVVAAIKALGAKYGKEIRSHREIRHLVRSLAREQGKMKLCEDFEKVERLHVNFYETDLYEEEIREKIAIAERLLVNLREILERC